MVLVQGLFGANKLERLAIDGIFELLVRAVRVLCNSAAVLSCSLRPRKHSRFTGSGEFVVATFNLQLTFPSFFRRMGSTEEHVSFLAAVGCLPASFFATCAEEQAGGILQGQVAGICCRSERGAAEESRRQRLVFLAVVLC